MKKLLFILLLGFASQLVFAQDVIYKLNGEEIKSKVIEITDDYIKYKKYDYEDGPLRNIKIDDVYMIIYENGQKEKFTIKKEQKKPKEVTPTAKNEIQTADNTKIEKVERSSYDGNYFMIGVGYGNSYGGIGTRIQFRVGGNFGFGMHAGVGYFPGLGGAVLASGGIKIFFYRGLYFNTQFGLTGIEEYTETRYYYDGDDYEYYYESHTLYGISLMTGGDWTWGNPVGFGFNAAMGATYNFNVERFSNFSPAVDLGFIIKF